MAKGWYQWDEKLSDDENAAKAFSCSVEDLQMSEDYGELIDLAASFLEVRHDDRSV